jgi:hypothetical protein
MSKQQRTVDLGYCRLRRSPAIRVLLSLFSTPSFIALLLEAHEPFAGLVQGGLDRARRAPHDFSGRGDVSAGEVVEVDGQPLPGPKVSLTPAPGRDHAR